MRSVRSSVRVMRLRGPCLLRGLQLKFVNHGRKTRHLGVEGARAFFELQLCRLERLPGFHVHNGAYQRAVSW